MWRPGFDFVERHPALLYGYHRSFCVYSYVHRGTPEWPGLVFGLDRGGSCRGLAFRVESAKADAVRDYLRRREQVTMIYVETVARLRLLDIGNLVEALCFTVNRSHLQYAGKLDFEDQVEAIVGAEGQSGQNPAYLENTVRHLNEMGIQDAELNRLLQAVEARLG
jgi:cation transport protein ChaC